MQRPARRAPRPPAASARELVQPGPMRCHFTARSSSYSKARTARMASAKTRTLPASSMARLRLVANRLPESAKIRARSTGEEECVALCPDIMGIREAECLQCQLDGPLEWFRVGPDVPPPPGLAEPATARGALGLPSTPPRPRPSAPVSMPVTHRSRYVSSLSVRSPACP